MELEFFELSLSSSEVLSLADPLLIVSLSQKMSVCKASARAIISFFFILGSLSALSFPLSCCIIIRESFLVPLRLGSSFLQVLLIFCEPKLEPRRRLQSISPLRLRTRSVCLYRLRRFSALLLLLLLLHWSISPHRILVFSPFLLISFLKIFTVLLDKYK